MVSQQSASIQLNKIDKIAPPGPPSLPIVNTLPFLSNYLHRELNQLAKKYGNIYQIRVGGKTFIVLNELEIIKEALVKQEDNFNGRANFTLYKLPPMCDFMEQKSGERWRRHRSIVGQVIHTCVVSKADIIESWALEEAADLANVFVNSGGQPFDPDLYVPRATLSFIQRLIFNKKGTINDPKEHHDYVATAHSGKRMNRGALSLTQLQLVPLIWRPIIFHSCFIPILDFVLTAPSVLRFIGKNVEQHKNSFEPENLQDVTDGLLKATSELTESDRNDLGLTENDIVKGSLIQFIGAGSEPPNVIIRWALLYMIAYPEFQAEIHKELDQVVGREKQPSLEHRGKLTFTAAFLNEVFRHSSATALPAFVYATTADTTLEGYFIPKNTPFLVNYYALTRDERYWQDPEQFNPYRFLGNNGKLKNDLVDKFYPFGIGSRRCIGEYIGRLLIFLLFTNLMHRCKFEKVSGEILNLEPQPAILQTQQNYTIVAKPRF